MNITSSDIDVIIQGPIFKTGARTPGNETKGVIESYRDALPNARIILSTWNGSDVNGINADEIIFSADPRTIWTQCPPAINLNRQIVSTNAGLEKSSRLYCLKTRTDLPINHDGFIELYKKWANRSRSAKQFKDRIVVMEIFTLSSRRSNYCYQLSDLSQFGLGQDIKELWDIPIYRWTLEAASHEKQTLSHVPEWHWSNEQYLWIKNMQKHSDFSLHAICSDEDHAEWERQLANNFIIATQKQYGIYWRGKLTIRAWAQTINHDEWKSLFRTHSQQNTIPRASLSRIIKHVIYALDKRESLALRVYARFYHWIVPKGSSIPPLRGWSLVHALWRKLTHIFLP